MYSLRWHFTVLKKPHSDLAMSGGITEKVNIISKNVLLQIQCQAITWTYVDL